MTYPKWILPLQKYWGSAGESCMKSLAIWWRTSPAGLGWAKAHGAAQLVLSARVREGCPEYLPCRQEWARQRDCRSKALQARDSMVWTSLGQLEANMRALWSESIWRTLKSTKWSGCLGRKWRSGPGPDDKGLISWDCEDERAVESFQVEDYHDHIYTLGRWFWPHDGIHIGRRKNFLLPADLGIC